MGDLTEASTHVDHIFLICLSSLLVTGSGLVTCRRAGGVTKDPDLVIHIQKPREVLVWHIKHLSHSGSLVKWLAMDARSQRRGDYSDDPS